MRKITVSTLVISILLTTAATLNSQTRPRRVVQTSDSFSDSTSQPREEERPRLVVGSQPTNSTEGIRERIPRENPWPRILLGAGIAIGAGRIGHGTSCAPSRQGIWGIPRFVSQSDSA